MAAQTVNAMKVQYVNFLNIIFSPFRVIIHINHIISSV